MSISDLLPASFRGVPFAVVRSGGEFGRRLAVHQYPGRDTPWAEDLGRSARVQRLSGFILQGDLVYGGAAIDLQRAALIAAAEAPGAGLLTHPTLGVLNVSCTSLSISDGLEADNYAEIEFSFVEAGQQLFPSLLVSTTDAVFAAVATAALAVATDVASALTLAQGQSSTGGADTSAAVLAWRAQVEASARDATSVLGLTSLLSGSYGRYSSGANDGFSTGTIYVNSATVSDLVTASSAARLAVTTSSTALGKTVQSQNVTTTTADISTGITGLINALLAACADPADALRLLGALQAFAFGSTGCCAVVGDAFRRAAVVDVAKASANYQPSSYDDAVRVLGVVTAALDAEIEVAGNEGADATYLALRAARQTVVADLTYRGANLAPIRAFNVGVSLPDVVLAQRLYRDPSRADQLTTQVDEIHPFFMPTRFKALAA